MFHELQETHVESLKRHLSAWKKEAGCSEMTMFDEIVKAHDRICGPRKTGIHFSDGRDEYNRQKANAIRIKRLLAEDEEGTGREQADQLVNLMPSILAAMPAHLRISFLNEYLAPLDLHVAANEDATDGEAALSGLAEMIRKDALTHQAYAQVIEHPDLLSLTAAQRDLLDSIETKKKQWRIVTAMIRARGAAGSVIKKAGSALGRAVHRTKVQA